MTEEAVIASRVDIGLESRIFVNCVFVFEFVFVFVVFGFPAQMMFRFF